MEVQINMKSIEQKVKAAIGKKTKAANPEVCGGFVSFLQPSPFKSDAGVLPFAAKPSSEADK